MIKRPVKLKLPLLIVIILIGMLILGVSLFKVQNNGYFGENLTSPTPVPIENEKWKQYEGNGIIFKYPSSIHLVETYTDLKFMNDLKDMNIYLYFEREKQSTPETRKQELINSPLKGYEGYEVSNLSVEKINTYDILKYESKALGSRYANVDFFYNGYIYNFSKDARANDRNLDQMFDEVLRSVSFSNDLSSNASDINSLLRQVDLDKKFNIPSDQQGILNEDSAIIEEDWATIPITLVSRSTKVNIGNSLYIIGHKINGKWQFVFEGEPRFKEWKNQLPLSIRLIK